MPHLCQLGFILYLLHVSVDNRAKAFQLRGFRIVEKIPLCHRGYKAPRELFKRHAAWLRFRDEGQKCVQAERAFTRVLRTDGVRHVWREKPQEDDEVLGRNLTLLLRDELEHITELLLTLERDTH